MKTSALADGCNHSGPRSRGFPHRHLVSRGGAARRAAIRPPRHDQPKICMLGWLRIDEAGAGLRAVRVSGGSKPRHRAGFAVDKPGHFEFESASGVHPGGDSLGGGPRSVEFGAGAIDSSSTIGFSSVFRPARSSESCLATALGAPEGLIGHCFRRRIGS
jgi:hypothetical protein